MYFELLTNSCLELQAVVCAGGRKGWECCGVDQPYSLVWQGSADVSVAPQRDCLHRERATGGSELLRPITIPQIDVCWTAPYCSVRVVECGKACLQSVKDRTLLLSSPLLKACTAGVGRVITVSGLSGDRRHSQVLREGLLVQGCCGTVSFAPLAVRTCCLSRSIGCQSFPLSEFDICLLCSVPCWVAFPWKVAPSVHVCQVVVGCVPLSPF